MPYQPTSRFGQVSVGLYGTLLIPSAVYMFGHTSSMTSGLLVAQLVWLVAAVFARHGRLVTGWRRRDLLNFLFATFMLTAFSCAQAVLLGPIDRVRLIGSTVILMISYLCGTVAAFEIARAGESELKRTMGNCLKLLFVFAALAFVGVPALGPGDFEKPVILFTEKSHYALALAPILIFGTVVWGGKVRWLILGGGTFVALGLQNTTALAAVIIVLSTVLSVRNFVLIVLLSLGLGILLNTDYYTARLDLSGDSHNLSALVFLSGWERAWLNIQETWGLGVGFQQFGVVGSLGDLMELVEVIAQGPLNLNDGGTTASKLVGEFGAAGVTALAAYVYVFVRAVLRLRRFALSRLRSPGDLRRAFWDSYIAAAALDLFVRGQGYFSVGMFMLLVALIGRRQSERLNRHRPFAPRGTSTLVTRAP